LSIAIIGTNLRTRFQALSASEPTNPTAPQATEVPTGPDR
jgi:hypothetical protein